MKIDRKKMFIAALTAQRINQNEYVGKNSLVRDKPYNFSIMEDVLAGKITPTEDDINRLKSFEEALNAWVVYSALANTVNDFERSVANIISEDEIDFSKLKIVACLPHMVVRRERDQKQKSMFDSAKQEFAGIEGEKITFIADIVKCIYSDKWKKFYITVLTDTGHIMSFGSPTALPEFDRGYKFSGTITTFISDQYCLYNTRLNRVKRVA
jgi:hypothetical protein